MTCEIIFAIEVFHCDLKVRLKWCDREAGSLDEMAENPGLFEADAQKAAQDGAQKTLTLS